MPYEPRASYAAPRPPASDGLAATLKPGVFARKPNIRRPPFQLRIAHPPEAKVMQVTFDRRGMGFTPRAGAPKVIISTNGELTISYE